MNYLAAALIGLFGGIASGLFGVGGGVIMVPAMVYFLNLPIKTAIGTSLVVIVPTAIAGSAKHFTQGNIHWATAWSLIPTAVVGGVLGTWLTSIIPAAGLKRAFGGFIILIGLRLLLAK
jgi:uncharacterized membrane protein YfcA